MIDHIDATARMHEQRRRIHAHDGSADDTEVFSVFIFDTRTAPNRRPSVVEAPITTNAEIGPGWWERTRASLSGAGVFGISLRPRGAKTP